MAYRHGSRKQMTLLPKSIEEYVAPDCPVRAYHAFVDALDFRDLGIVFNPGKVGNTEYHPQAMLKLLVYGYSYGVKSSRKLERETRNNLSFIWLMGGLTPDHKTPHRAMPGALFPLSGRRPGRGGRGRDRRRPVPTQSMADR